MHDGLDQNDTWRDEIMKKNPQHIDNEDDPPETVQETWKPVEKYEKWEFLVSQRYRVSSLGWNVVWFGIVFLFLLILYVYVQCL